MSTTDSNMEDLQNLNLIRQGGKVWEQGYSLLYRKYAAHFNKFFLYHGLNASDAEDIVQETFENIVKKCNTYRGDAPLVAWLWVIARNCMTNHFRHTGARIPANYSEDIEGQEQEDEFEIMGALGTNQNDGTFEDCVTRALVDCVQRAFTEFKNCFPDYALALSLRNEGYGTTHIAAELQWNADATRQRIGYSKKKCESFLQHCREYLSAV